MKETVEVPDTVAQAESVGDGLPLSEPEGEPELEGHIELVKEGVDEAHGEGAGESVAKAERVVVLLMV